MRDEEDVAVAGSALPRGLGKQRARGWRHQVVDRHHIGAGFTQHRQVQFDEVQGAAARRSLGLQSAQNIDVALRHQIEVDAGILLKPVAKS